jgi:hypothetical protein
VAQSWPKRRLDDWLNHAALTRPVTPEVAGSSPVAPASEVPAHGHFPATRSIKTESGCVQSAHAPARRTLAADRFFEKVDLSLFCWRWLGARSSTGYGTFEVSRDRVVSPTASPTSCSSRRSRPASSSTTSAGTGSASTPTISSRSRTPRTYAAAASPGAWRSPSERGSRQPRRGPPARKAAADGEFPGQWTLARRGGPLRVSP